MENLIQLLNFFIESFKKEILSEITSSIKEELKNQNSNTSADRLLSTKELTKLLQVSTSTIIKLRSEGLPCIRINDSVRFDKEQVLSFIKNYKPKNKNNKNERRTIK